MNSFDNHSQFFRPSLKVGFITPSLAPGGAERWLVDLIRNLSNVHCSGLVILDSAYEQPSLLPELPRSVQLYAPGDVSELAARSHLLVAWGHYDFLPIMREHHIPTVLVSHTSRQYVPGFSANFYGAVSTSAAVAYGTDITERVGVTVVPNGISPDRLSSRLSRGHAKEQLGLSSNRPAFLCVTRLSSEKNPGRVLDLARQYPGYDFVLYGWGPLSYSLASSLDSGTGNVRFVQPTFGPGIADIYRAADYALMVSPNEAFPLTFLEAAYCGLKTAGVHHPFVEEFDLEEYFWEGFDLDGLALDLSSPRKPPPLPDFFHIGRMASDWEKYFHQCHREFTTSNSQPQVLKR